MDKLACCCVPNGAPSPSYSMPSRTWLAPPPCRRSIPILRCILTNPKRATTGDDVSFDFERYMSANAKAAHEALDRAMPVRRPERLSEAMRYSVLAGGKRVRPVLAIAACELVGGSAAAASPVACAVEMVHTMSLIHDDMLEYIHLNKTARLIEAAAVCGAVVGGGTDGEIESVRRYARSVGLLFQVVDDVLDVTRTSEQLGKTAGKDQAADKATYAKLLGVDQARAYAGELLAMAEGELQGFDADRAARLHHLARFIAYRHS
ncbi:unnamed protein product [Alopecurus aequalis]